MEPERIENTVKKDAIEIFEGPFAKRSDQLKTIECKKQELQERRVSRMASIPDTKL